MTSPKISYIMASYNHDRYVGEMIGSILSQTFSDLELVIVDDGSTDETISKIQTLISTDSRIRLILQSNSGVVAARNHGILAAQGEFACIVDSDDLLSIDHADRLLKAFIDDPEIVFAYGDSWFIDANGVRGRRFSELHPVIDGNISVELFRNYCFISAQTVMFRKSSMLTSDLLWGAGPTTDYIKWIELGIEGAATRIEGGPIASWRHHGSNVSQSYGHSRAQQLLDLQYDLELLLDKHPRLRSKLTETEILHKYADCYFKAGYFLALAREWVDARHNFSKAWQTEISVVTGLAFLATLPLLREVACPALQWVERNRKVS